MAKHPENRKEYEREIGKELRDIVKKLRKKYGVYIVVDAKVHYPITTNFVN